MGHTDENLEIVIHRCNVSPPVREVVLHRHLGLAGVDAWSPPATVDAWRAYRLAVMAGDDDAKVHALGFTAWGSWYRDHIACNPRAFIALRGCIFDAVK